MDINKTNLDQYTKDINSYIFKSIKSHRQEKKYTILDLAAKCDVSAGYLSDVENGKHSNVSLRFLLKICLALELNLDELLRESFQINGFYKGSSK